MTIELYIAFVVATSLLIMTPGPMVALIIANALRFGPAYAFWTVAGSVLAMAAQMMLVSFGLSSLLAQAGAAFFWLKWIGVAYLVFLALRALTAPSDELEIAATQKKPPRAVFWEAFLVSATNPKTLLFYGAFFPLFVSPSAPAGPQLMLLSITFLLTAAALDCCWAIFAAKARPFVARAGRWRHRLTGGVLLTAAAGLAVVRR